MPTCDEDKTKELIAKEMPQGGVAVKTGLLSFKRTCFFAPKLYVRRDLKEAIKLVGLKGMCVYECFVGDMKRKTEIKICKKAFRMLSSKSYMYMYKNIYMT